MYAIVLDGEQRSALAATRSLGKKGVNVIAGSEKLPSLSSCSRYCGKSFLYPSPYRDPAGFILALKKLAKTHPNSVLFPMTDVTMTEILLNRRELPESIAMPFADYEKYVQVTDKIRLFQRARELRVPIPSTFLSTEFENREGLIDSVGRSGFPVIVKPVSSKIRTGKGWTDARVRYATCEKELREILSAEIFDRHPFLVQERVEGPGVGIFLLMNGGKVIARFAHRRIREKPPSGGVSVLCESIEPPADAMETTVKILAELDWTGVAMVEFKIDLARNVAKLLEVNARFWGSLQLAVSSGVDFPYLLFRMAIGEKVERQDGYTLGLKSRWELGDLDHLFIRLLKNSSDLSLPSKHPARITLIRDFMIDFFRPTVRNEILQIQDPGPFFHEMKGYAKYLLQ